MARDFNGSSDYLVYSTTPVVTITPMTIACYAWIDTAQFQVMVGIRTVGSANGFFVVQGGAGVSFVLRAQTLAGGSSAFSSTAAAPSTGAWHSIVARFGSTTSRKISVDGVDATENTTSLSPAAADTAAIGRNNAAAPADYFDGKLAHVAIWDVALSDADVAAYHAATSSADIEAIDSGNLLSYTIIAGSASPEPDEVAAGTWSVNGTPAQYADPFAAAATRPAGINRGLINNGLINGGLIR